MDEINRQYLMNDINNVMFQATIHPQFMPHSAPSSTCSYSSLQSSYSSLFLQVVSPEQPSAELSHSSRFLQPLPISPQSDTTQSQTCSQLSDQRSQSSTNTTSVAQWYNDFASIVPK